MRDGLKPVHRRVLYAMHEDGLQPNRPHAQVRRASSATSWATTTRTATQAIYDTLVRMAQPFSLRYPLVDGQGNFGYLDDDAAAAMRYTECRLAKLATEMLRDIDADTVDFVPNYDESRQRAARSCRRGSRTCSSTARPASPSAWRRTCRRTTSARSIDAVVAMIDEPDDRRRRAGCATSRGPTSRPAAIIVGRDGIRDAYRTGRGRIVMRARAHIEELRGGKTAIIVTELPYGVKKGGDGGVIKKIADLVKDKVLPEITDRSPTTPTRRACGSRSSSSATRSRRSS